MTAPSGLGHTRDSFTTLVTGLTWTPGANGTKQKLYVDADKAKVVSGCPAGCSIKEENLASAAASYSNLSALETGRLYYWRLVNWKDAVCSNPEASTKFVDSCSLNPAALSLYLGDPARPLISQVYASAAITRVDFSSTTANVSLNPLSDPDYSYYTQVTGTAEGASTITGTVVLAGGINDCSNSIQATVLAPKAWWQAVGGDVHADGIGVYANPGATFAIFRVGNFHVHKNFFKNSSSDLRVYASNSSDKAWRGSTQMYPCASSLSVTSVLSVLQAKSKKMKWRGFQKAGS